MIIRIHKRIDNGLDGLLWLAINRLDLLLDEAREMEDESLELHRRTKKIIKIMNNLNPRVEVELVLKQKQLK